MVRILMESDTDSLQCKALLLQPTNSKPKNLIHLYDILQTKEWSLVDERIEKVSSRWYVSAAFVRERKNIQSNELEYHALPGVKLLTSGGNASKSIFQQYIHHHATWMAADQQYGKLDSSEKRWLRQFSQNNWIIVKKSQDIWAVSEVSHKTNKTKTTTHNHQ